MRLDDTFTANTTHASLLWLLSDYKFVYSAMVMIVRTRVERGHLRMESRRQEGIGRVPTPNNAVLDEVYRRCVGTIY